MKRIPNQLIKDYLIVECAWMCITFLAHPMLLTPDQRAVPLPVFKIVHVSFFLLTLVLSEIIVTYIFQNSFTYSAGIWGRLKHFALCAVIGVPIFNIFLNQSNTIMMWDFSRYYYAWFDIDGTFTLKWYMKTIKLCAILSVILIIAMMAITKVRNIEHTLLELASINRMLETEQTKLRSRLPKDNVTDKIVIHGDSHESLTVNPLDVIYVESVGNYLNIVYLRSVWLKTIRN